MAAKTAAELIQRYVSPDGTRCRFCGESFGLLLYTKEQNDSHVDCLFKAVERLDEQGVKDRARIAALTLQVGEKEAAVVKIRDEQRELIREVRGMRGAAPTSTRYGGPAQPGGAMPAVLVPAPKPAPAPAPKPAPEPVPKKERFELIELE